MQQLKEVKFNNIERFWGLNAIPQWINWAVGLAEKKEDGTFDVVLQGASCRTYSADAMYFDKVHSEYSAKGRFHYCRFDKKFNYNNGKFYVIASFHKEMAETFVNKGIDYLHKKEEEAGVYPCKVYTIQGAPQTFLIEASKKWKKNIWKYVLYTFYIKTASYSNPKTCDPNYWSVLTEEKEKILLSNVKKNIKEIFDTSVYGSSLKDNVHECTGFISILTGHNDPMAKLLGVIK